MEGIQGVTASPLTISVIAFTIVFVVLAGLTAVIYAIKLFAAEGGNGKPEAPKAPPVSKAPTASVAAPVAADANKSRIVAVVTAAILAQTQGRGSILSIAPLGRTGAAALLETTRAWRSAGVFERVSGRLTRSWKQ